MLSPKNNCFRQGEAKLRASEHGIVYLYLAFEANGPLRLIKAKNGRYSVLSARHTAPPEELEYTREAGVF